MLEDTDSTNGPTEMPGVDHLDLSLPPTSQQSSTVTVASTASKRSRLGSESGSDVPDTPCPPRKRLAAVTDSESDSGSESDDTTRGKQTSSKAGSIRPKDTAARSKTAAKTVDPHRFAVFRGKLHSIDPYAEVSEKTPRLVHCSACKAEVVMRTLYDVKYFKTHRNRAKCLKMQKTGLVNPTIRQWFSKQSSRNSTPSVSVPCPGLTRESDPKIANYLARTATLGGGAPSRPALAKAMFGITWSQLTRKQQASVIRKETTLYAWRNQRSLGAVFSTSCADNVSVRSLTVEPEPCFSCTRLRALSSFRTQLLRPMPDDANMKYVPKSWRDETLGNLYLKYHGLRNLVEQVCVLSITASFLRISLMYPCIG